MSTNSIHSKPSHAVHWHFNYVIYFLIFLITVLISAGLYWLNEQDKKETFFSIAIKDIPENELLVKYFFDETYLIIKVQPSLQLQQLPELNNKLRQTEGIRVYSVASSHGFILLPSKSSLSYDVPCMKFEYIYEPFIHDNKNIAGGFKCSYSISTWWEKNLVFNLQGKNIKSGMRHLYTPQFYIHNGRLRIGEGES